MVLQQFFPIEDLTIMAENFRDSKIPPSLLMQNRVTLSTVESDLDVTIKLNDLLLINSKEINIENPQLPQKLLNNFIKLWQRGSNLRMEYLYIDYFDGEENDEQIVMKGIKYEVNPLDRVRNFKSVGSNYSGPVYGGMDVYRVDGVKATIVFNRYETFSIWEMYVWFDHCVS
ncbi:hypothetical protein CAEBREN_07701 [Caenorhabditis brenneri]|uniref:Sdz-33 F-box domain-containing protein n=1 Tax=Caenorhabditis brenneri TaxID=135651 RepID=G0N0H2_CAEBE|nr:hypothetical protein CAEBREN_07701 [Caenorhabditis brenneri]